MKTFISFNKRYLVVELVCLLIFGTVVLIPVDKISVSIALAEIIAIGIFLYMFIYRGLYKHNYSFSRLSKRVFWVLFSFGIYFVILFGVRFVKNLPFALTTWPIRSWILGSSVFFIMDGYKPKINHLLSGILIIYSALNIREMVDCFRFTDIRKLTFLDNINIYMYISIMFITFAVWAIKESKEKRLPKWTTPVAYLNIGISMVFAFLSGGRLGWVVMGAVIVVSIILLFGFKWYSWKRIISFMIVCLMVTILAASVNFMKSRSNVYRTFSFIVSKIPALTQPKSDDEEENGAETTEASDAIRGIFWSKAWTAIKKNPIVGAGTFAVAYKESVPVTDQVTGKKIILEEPIQRPAHNFILETWMGWGLIGLIMYLTSLIAACYYILIKLTNIPKVYRFCCILPIVSAAFLSLLQSFILLNFQAAYIVWFCLGFAAVLDNHYKNTQT
ncbi:O-antigen ligase family protein [Clostridium lacusfryxellense]|uniref:O-antigen ligase family protein n=1 Tax=Clostridium lacusfryxellense TaxID=205328 RepID=UPI001C0CDC7A|nr:O-antigen ligase family protein [Clostridium lacusfryxellense]MBU3111446.1 O-antigen ligase family protein [Clostridium lacusfryxellense]